TLPMLFLDAARDKAPGKRTKSKVEVTRSIIFAEWQTETKDLRTGKCEKTIPSHHVLLPRPRVSRRPPSVQDWEECQLQSLCSLSRASFFWQSVSLALPSFSLSNRKRSKSRLHDSAT